jgi:hypothetical protein
VDGLRSNDEKIFKNLRPDIREMACQGVDWVRMGQNDGFFLTFGLSKYLKNAMK